MKFLCLECNTAMKFKESKNARRWHVDRNIRVPGLLWGIRNAHEPVGNPNAQVT